LQAWVSHPKNNLLKKSLKDELVVNNDSILFFSTRVMRDEKDIAAWKTAHAQIKNKLTPLQHDIKEIVKKLNIQIQWPKTYGGLVAVLECIPEEHYQAVIQRLNGDEVAADEEDEPRGNVTTVALKKAEGKAATKPASIDKAAAKKAAPAKAAADKPAKVTTEATQTHFLLLFRYIRPS
jgi:D-aminopeptidase